MRVGAIVPACNEEGNIGPVVEGLLALREAGGGRLVDDLVVCDNASTDGTASEAARAGARVASEPRPGYGQACLTAMAELSPVDAVLFIDGDQSFVAGQSSRLLRRLSEGADLVIGSRALGRAEAGAMSVPQMLGNRVAAALIRLLWRRSVTDLGPFRVIRSDALKSLGMRDTAYGWTVEMQVRAIQLGLRVAEVPVDTSRRRYGRSKVGGTIRGVAGASAGILSTIVGLWLRAHWGRDVRASEVRAGK